VDNRFSHGMFAFLPLSLGGDHEIS
jgi:hypothetical protein